MGTMLDLLNPDLLSSLLVAVEDTPRPVPEDSEVKAGYVALFLWLGMAVAVALLGWSLIRQFRKVSAARDAGVYGDPVISEEDGTEGGTEGFGPGVEGGPATDDGQAPRP